MNLAEYIKENIVSIPKGQELIRDFIDPVKWLSSDYKMSAPGTRKAKNTREELQEVKMKRANDFGLFDMIGSGAMICMMRNDMKTIVYSGEGVLQVKKEPVVPLQEGRVFRNFKLMIWALE